MVYLHKCFALGLRNHHIDVNSSEEADSSKDDETVGPNGLLGHKTKKQEGREDKEMTGTVLAGVWGGFVSHEGVSGWPVLLLLLEE